MAPALALILKAAASSILGRQLQTAVTDKVTAVIRDKLDLPPEADAGSAVEALAASDPVAYQALVEQATSIRIAEETTVQMAIEQMGLDARVAMTSESAYVRNARPTMLYMGGLSCFSLILFGVVIAWTKPMLLGVYVDLVSAVAMPLGLLLTAGGVYTYRRTTDKAIAAGSDTTPNILKGLLK